MESIREQLNTIKEEQLEVKNEKFDKNWDGDAAELFLKKYTKLETHIGKTIQLIDETSVKIKAAKKNIESSEKENVI